MFAMPIVLYHMRGFWNRFANIFRINIDGARCVQSQKKSRWTNFCDFSDLFRSPFMEKGSEWSSMTGGKFCVVMELDLAS